jgi:hypothetical protein
MVICALPIVRMAFHDPRYLFPLAIAVFLLLLPPFLSRRRMRAVLLSGDVKRVLGTWEGSLERVLYPETMAPLMAATAYAAYGWIESSRRSLSRAVHGPAWDAALEQRLFVETLLDTFEGERQMAMRKAEALELMPLPASGLLARRKIAMLRRGLSALARAFAHESRTEDERVLRTASRASPLIHWAMRYASAVVAIDRGKGADARALLDGAPEWPKESAFRVFHDELASKIG